VNQGQGAIIALTDDVTDDSFGWLSWPGGKMRYRLDGGALRRSAVAIWYVPFPSNSCQQRLGLLGVGSAKALSKPAVHLGQQLVRFGALPLALPEATQAQRCSQLPGFGPLACLPQKLPVETVVLGSFSRLPVVLMMSSASARTASPSAWRPACPYTSASRARNPARKCDVQSSARLPAPDGSR
jgi:hypothetical protein